MQKIPNKLKKLMLMLKLSKNDNQKEVKKCNENSK